jgi:hypothetical protein
LDFDCIGSAAGDAEAGAGGAAAAEAPARRSLLRAGVVVPLLLCGWCAGGYCWRTAEPARNARAAQHSVHAGMSLGEAVAGFRGKWRLSLVASAPQGRPAPTGVTIYTEGASEVRVVREGQELLAGADREGLSRFLAAHAGELAPYRSAQVTFTGALVSRKATLTLGLGPDGRITDVPPTIRFWD